MEYAALKLSVLCVAVFALQQLVPGFTEQFMLVRDEVLAKPWQIVTHAFLHADILHLFYNIFALSLFGSVLEEIIGTRRFLKVLFLSILVSALVSLAFYPAVLGISGGVFGILACLAVLRPGMIVWIYGVPMPMIGALVLWGAVNFTGMLFPSQIAYASHLAGMLAGIAYGVFLKTARKADYL